MSKAIPLYKNIAGAPFSIEATVRVVLALDDGAEPYLDRIGTIEYYEYNCGCGQTFPTDPLIGVRFDPDTLYEFWKEELSNG